MLTMNPCAGTSPLAAPAETRAQGMPDLDLAQQQPAAVASSGSWIAFDADAAEVRCTRIPTPSPAMPWTNCSP